MSWLVDRLKEPSTYAGLAAILAAIFPKMGIDAGTLQTIGAAVLAVAAIVLKDKGK